MIFFIITSQLSKVAMMEEAFSTHGSNLVMPNGNEKLFRLLPQPNCPPIKFQEEGKKKLEWTCQSIRYKYLNLEDGTIPTSDDFEDLYTTMDMILESWDKYDRFYYLFKDCNGVNSRLVIFGMNKFACGVVVLQVQNFKYLIFVLDPNVDNVITFFDNCGFLFQNRITYLAESNK